MTSAQGLLPYMRLLGEWKKKFVTLRMESTTWNDMENVEVGSSTITGTVWCICRPRNQRRIWEEPSNTEATPPIKLSSGCVLTSIKLLKSQTIRDLEILLPYNPSLPAD